MKKKQSSIKQNQLFGTVSSYTQSLKHQQDGHTPHTLACGVCCTSSTYQFQLG